MDLIQTYIFLLDVQKIASLEYLKTETRRRALDESCKAFLAGPFRYYRINLCQHCLKHGAWLILPDHDLPSHGDGSANMTIMLLLIYMDHCQLSLPEVLIDSLIIDCLQCQSY